MKAPTVSFLTPVLNGEAFIGEAIASVRSQTFDDWEYVIVDNGSSDSTVDVVRAAIDVEPRINLVFAPPGNNQFFAANQGLQHVRGRYIACLDADDIALPDRLENQLGFLRSTGLRACAGGWLSFRDGARPHGRFRGTGIPPAAVAWSLMVQRNLVHSSAFVDREAFDALGGYSSDENAADFQLWCELARRGWLGTAPQVVTHKREHRFQDSRLSADAIKESAIRVLDRHVGEMTGESWKRGDLALLYDLQRRSVTPLGAGRRVLERWASSWRGDRRVPADANAYLQQLKRRLALRLFVLRGPLASVLGARR